MINPVKRSVGRSVEVLSINDFCLYNQHLETIECRNYFCLAEKHRRGWGIFPRNCKTTI
jgi:hypothetical protein